ncbi:glycosyltransferase family 2 protein [Epilithonimonas caeni]|uniref:glycosyltransferase family 2 protein n=1 Tax=Epilithonimonas caeni TaxID=365343 RepID=UPI0003F64362|nr:glycosyltransferase family A protein [Epilithonimonas caeni]
MLTLFTPTYNRATLLPTLFESLKKQSNKKFEWLIVDDGSTDNTREVIKSFIETSAFRITYLYQENQGKHIAINTAINYCNTEYFGTVDSDDYLKDEAIEIIYEKLEKIRYEKNIIGIASPLEMVDSKKNIVTRPDIFAEITATPVEIGYTYKIYGEFTLVYKTEIIKKYQYPQFFGEKFIQESFITNRFDKEYKILHIPESVVIGEYRDDGLTAQSKQLLINNPRGAALVFCEKMNNPTIPFSARKKFVKNYWDFESINNPSFISKLHKIKNLRLKFSIIYYFSSKKINTLLKK